jgi:hypothetical protein
MMIWATIISATFFSAQGTPVSSLPRSHLPPSVSCHPIPSHHIPSRLANDYTEIQIADPRSICPPGFAQRGVPGCVSTAAPSLASSQLNKGLQPPEIKPHKGLLASLRQLPVLSSFPCHPPRLAFALALGILSLPQSSLFFPNSSFCKLDEVQYSWESRNQFHGCQHQLALTGQLLPANMSLPTSAAELKAQGVVEAAQDPNSSVTADDAQQKIVTESKKAGVAAFTFNPDASPEEKAAQARAVSTTIGRFASTPLIRTLL